jgi:hypothetical protein
MAQYCLAVSGSVVVNSEFQQSVRHASRRERSTDFIARGFLSPGDDHQIISLE